MSKEKEIRNREYLTEQSKLLKLVRAGRINEANAIGKSIVENFPERVLGKDNEKTETNPALPDTKLDQL